MVKGCSSVAFYSFNQEKITGVLDVRTRGGFVFLPSIVSILVSFCFTSSPDITDSYFEDETKINEEREQDSPIMEFGDAGFCGGRKAGERKRKLWKKGETNNKLNPHETTSHYGNRPRVNVGGKRADPRRYP